MENNWLSAIENNPKLSIVIPLYNEQENVQPLYSELKDVLEEISLDYEVIFIDDGSTDKTYNLLTQLTHRDSYVQVMRNEKKCGQSFAYITGLNHAKGKIIITMDGDLQNDPTDIKKFLKKIGEGFDFVSGKRTERKDPIWRKVISLIANLIIGLKTKKFLDYGCSYNALSKELIPLIRYFPNEIFLKPLLACFSNSIAEVEVFHRQRYKGYSKYNFLKIIKLGVVFLLYFHRPKKYRDC